jgi:tellurite resistance protein TerC
VFLAVVVVLLVLDLGVLNRKDHAIGVSESLKLPAVYVAAGLLFGLWISCSAARCRLPCHWRSRAGA